MPSSTQSPTMTELLQSLFFTKAGIEFNNYRSVAATRLLKEAEAKGQSFFFEPLSHIPGGYNLMVIAILPPEVVVSVIFFTILHKSHIKMGVNPEITAGMTTIFSAKV